MRNNTGFSRLLVALGILIGFSVPAFAFADTAACNGSTFDNFSTGSVNGQGGWSTSGDDDQEIVPNTFGYANMSCKVLRMSDATTSVFIYNQVFSATTTHEAGETDAVSNLDFPPQRDNHFDGEFYLASVVDAEQAGMHLSVSPDRGDGTRMGALNFLDTASGIDVYFDDFTGTTSPTTFNESYITTLPRGVAHDIKLSMDFLDGPSNDVAKLYIDGNLMHTGTSWENFYRYDASAYPAPNDKSRTVKSLVFYAQGTAHPSNQFNGFLIGNVSLSTSNVATSTGTTTNAFPVITLNGSSTMNIDLNSTFMDPGATATDAEDGTLTVTATGTVNTAATGTYQILYSATDSGNQTATTSRTVNVIDNSSTSTSTATSTASSSLPVITLNGASSMQILKNDPFTDPGATAVDSNGHSLTVTATGTVDTSALGTYHLTYSATDANHNTATTSRTVEVVGTVTTTGGGGGGGSSSGGGYFISVPQTNSTGSNTITVTPVSSTNNPVTITLLPTSSTGQVLGVTTVNFGRNLKVGMTGDDILALQTLLKNGGYLVINVPTNYFGPKTMKALMKWQKAHKLPATGFFGPMSRVLITK